MERMTVDGAKQVMKMNGTDATKELMQGNDLFQLHPSYANPTFTERSKYNTWF